MSAFMGYRFEPLLIKESIVKSVVVLQYTKDRFEELKSSWLSCTQKCTIYFQESADTTFFRNTCRVVIGGRHRSRSKDEDRYIKIQGLVMQESAGTSLSLSIAYLIEILAELYNVHIIIIVLSFLVLLSYPLLPVINIMDNVGISNPLSVSKLLCQILNLQ